MTKRQLINKAYDLLIQNLNKNSKWYEQDCEDLWKHLQTRTTEQLQNTINNQQVINKPQTERELKMICDTSFLNKLDKKNINKNAKSRSKKVTK